MFAEITSPLTWNLIVICLVWITGIIIVQIIKLSLLKSLNAAAESENSPEDSSISDKILAQKVRVKQGARIFSAIITATTIVTLLVFALFMNSSRVKPESEVQKIEQAPLPENFKPQTAKEIEQSNKQVVTEKSAELQKKATEANTKAMNDGINIFKKAK
jgi:mannitol-specific phosphotransferase system IIBC component